MRWPLTLWRALLADLWKVLLLTTAVVVAVTAFAVAVRPLAEGKLGPDDAVRFMGYALVPMLQYALPFAGGFAATLAHHRLAADNELTACAAGGVSYVRLLAPAALTGLVLAGVLMVLADQAMPRLLRQMQSLITQDVMRLFMSSIERDEAIGLGEGRMVYADSATPARPDPGSGASDYLILSGVLAVETDAQGRVTREAAARVAHVWVYRGLAGTPAGAAATTPNAPATPASGRPDAPARDDATTTVVLRLQDSIGQRQDLGLSELEDSTVVYRVPDAFADDPKYLTWRQMQAVAARPESINWIDRRRRELAGLLAQDAWAQGLHAALARSGEVTLLDAAGRPVTLRAAGLGPRSNVAPFGWPLLTGDEPAPNGTGGAGESARAGASGRGDGAIRPRSIVVTTRSAAQDRRDQTRVIRTQRARRGVLSIRFDESAHQLRARVDLEDVATSGPLDEPAAGEAPGTLSAGVPATGQLERWSLRDLRAAAAEPGAARAVLEAPADDLVARARDHADPVVRQRGALLAQHLFEMRREVLSKQHERLAASAACLVMVVAGAVMALRLRESTPLAVYLWSFLPALGAVLTISGGQRTTHNHGTPGLLLLWGGVAALALLTLVEYRRLARH